MIADVLYLAVAGMGFCGWLRRHVQEIHNRAGHRRAGRRGARERPVAATKSRSDQECLKQGGISPR